MSCDEYGRRGWRVGDSNSGDIGSIPLYTTDTTTALCFTDQQLVVEGSDKVFTIRRNRDWSTSISWSER